MLTLAYGLSGYWQGFVTGASATVGLLLGGALGVVVLPQLVRDFTSSLALSLGALIGVLVSALVGQALGSFVGARARGRITWKPARSLDAVGGAALSMAAVLAVAWAVGYAVGGTKLPPLSEQVRSSTVLSRVDSVMPDLAEEALSAFSRVVDRSLFPRYIQPFSSEQIPDVARPDRGVLSRPRVVAAAESVVKVTGEAASCDRMVVGSGFVYADERVMTNAHVVAGVEEPIVTSGEQELAATVVVYDAELDVAVLAVDGLDAPPLAWGGAAESEDRAAVLGFPENGPYDAQPARIRDRQSLRGPDIYDEGTVVRDVYSVRALVRSGNSGGPLVSPRGRVLGVVFAASLSDASTGYVLTADLVADRGAQGVSSESPVPTGACA